MKKNGQDHIVKFGPPSWVNVRPIYKKLSDEFHILTNAFGISLTEREKLNMDHLITVIDEVDNCIDDIPSKADRDSITEALVSFLKDEHKVWTHPIAPKSLRERIDLIKVILHESNIVDDFISIAKVIFHFTEIKRHTEDQDKLIDYIQEEGIATAKLPLLFMNESSESPFGVFFSALCQLMGIADLVFDAKEDYSNNYIAVKPSITLYLKLSKIMFLEGLRILYRFPQKLKFLVYCCKFTYLLMRS